MNIFITGGTGFVGSYVVWQLLNNNHNIKALKRKTSSLWESEIIFEFLNNKYSKHFSIKDIQWVEGDILDYPSLISGIQGCEKIFHLAASVNFNPSKKKENFAINLEGTTNMVNAALELSIPDFNYLSSVATLPRVSGKMIDEEDKFTIPDFYSNYSQSKYMAELEVWRGSNEGLKVTVVNPGIILGFGDFNKGSIKIIKTILDGLPVYPSGSNGFVGVEDVANMFIKASEESNLKGERFCLVAENLLYIELFELIGKYGNVPIPKIKSGKILNGIAWRLFKIMSFFTGKEAIVTRETAHTAAMNFEYNGKKIIKTLDLNYQSIESVIDECLNYKSRKKNQ